MTHKFDLYSSSMTLFFTKTVENELKFQKKIPKRCIYLENTKSIKQKPKRKILKKLFFKRIRRQTFINKSTFLRKFMRSY